MHQSTAMHKMDAAMKYVPTSWEQRLRHLAARSKLVTLGYVLAGLLLAGATAGLAYLARWAFSSEAAFFGVLAFDAVVAVIVYRIALQSAVEAADRLKETMIAALSAGEGPIST